MFTKTVSYKGLNGQQKSKDLNFIIQRSDVLRNEATFNEFEKVKDMLFGLDTKVALSQKDSMRLMRTVLDIIKLGYAEVDFDNDVIDKSEEVTKRFENSLAYEALLAEIVERPELAIELVEGIANSMNLSEKEQSHADKLKAEFISKTTRQNGNNLGQSVVDEPKSDEIIELEKRLAELKGGQ